MIIQFKKTAKFQEEFKMVKNFILFGGLYIHKIMCVRFCVFTLSIAELETW